MTLRAILERRPDSNAKSPRRRVSLSAKSLQIVTLLLTAGLGLLVIDLSTSLAGSGTTVGPIQSSPIAIGPFDQRLVNVNPTASTVSVFDVTPAIPTKLAEIPVGRDPESVAIHVDGVRAYVANALDGTVSVINLASLTKTATINVGVEPMAVALSPNGTRLYVANASSNSLTVINTATNAAVATVDLSGIGTSPRAIAVTNNGDGNDADEKIFVPMFFAQLRAGKTFVQEGEDDQREGRIAVISAATNTIIGAIDLAPLSSTGFNANGRLAPGPGQVPAVPSTNPQTFTTPTGAFPNQLAAMAFHPLQPHRAYVVSTGASPNGPLRFNSMAQGLVSVIDPVTQLEVFGTQTDPNVRRTAPLNLNQGINLATTPAPRLFMTNPVAMAFRPNGADAWIAIQNSDLVVRATFDTNGVPTIGAPLVAGPSTITRVDLQTFVTRLTASEAPRGIVINSTGTRAYVSNFISRSVATLDISNPTSPVQVALTPSTALPAPNSIDAEALFGASMFFTGRGPQGRMSSESWGGCVVCHPRGLSDNVTWMFDAGPRQTISLDGMFNKNNPNDQRILNWSAVRDENHDFELNTRGVFGGRGLIDDDRLFLAVGGELTITGTDSASIEEFQQFTGAVGNRNDLAKLQQLPVLPAGRRDFGIATLGDDRVFIFGGRSGFGQGALVTGPNTVMEFNPRTNKLTPKSSTGFTARHSLGAAAVETPAGTRLYAVGGYASTSSSAPATATVEEYNPFTDTWRTVASLPIAVAQFGITVAGGINTLEPKQLIHVASGNVGSEQSPIVPSIFELQRFDADPVGPGTWSTFFFTGVTPRRNHGIATALRGTSSRIFVIGGQNFTGGVLDTVEEYQAQNPSAVFTPHTPLPSPRARFGVGSTLSSNQIYVMGGLDATGGPQSTIFEYSIATNGPVAGPPGTPSGAWVMRANLSSNRIGLGVSTPPGVTNFLPFANEGRDSRQDAIAVWIARNVRSSRAPVPAADPLAQAGRTLFGTVGLVQPGFSCATCHGGPKWTRSTVDYVAPPSPDDNLGLGNEKVIGAELRKTATQPGIFPGVLVNVGTFTLGGGRTNEIRVNPADPSSAVNPLGANGFNIPSLLNVHETAPYFYSGLAQTLDNVLDGSRDGNGGTQHHFVANPTQRAQLIAFLRSIDQMTPTFP